MSRTFLSCIETAVWISLAIIGLPATLFAETARIYLDPAAPQHVFAAGDIRAALEARDFKVDRPHVMFC